MTQLAGAIVVPVVFGGICGVVLGAAQLGFNLLMLVAGIGGILGGFEHATAREGVLRGLVGGVVFAGALLLAFEARGVPALVPLPASIPVMAVIYAIIGMPLGALGGWLRGRSEARRARVVTGS
jgi:hypothetical protein